MIKIRKTSTEEHLTLNRIKIYGRCNTNNKTNYLGYCKINNNGDKYYLIPCYRKSDNKPVLYDLVNDVFYTNSGTGEFVVGENQTNPSYSEEITYTPNSIFKYLTIDLGNVSGDYKDFDMLYRLTVPLQNNIGYGRVNFNQSTNKFSLLNNVPDISGNITIDYRTINDLAKHSAIIAAFPNLTINYSSIYINFEDVNIYKGLRDAGIGDIIGISNQQATAITTQIPSFQNNTSIVTFNELGEYFTGVTTIKSCQFQNCSNLREIDLTNISNIEMGAFAGAGFDGKDISFPKLANLPQFTSNDYNAGYFEGCKFRSFSADICTTLGGNTTDRDGGCFENCSKLKRVELRDITNITHTSSFRGCSALTTFIIDNETPPTITANVFSGAPNATFYVPDSAVSTYQAATNWSTYSSRIKGLSELPTE